MNVAVIGAGYVGLTTAAALAWVGHDVHVVEVDEGRVERLRAGSPPFFEAHLAGALQACGPRLHVTTAHAEALAGAEVAFLAVGTPPDERGAADLTQVHAAFEQVLEVVRATGQDLVLVTKSTVPVGTGDELADRLREERLHARVLVASNPEFLRQGRALRDSLYPDRVVLGGPEDATATLRRLYRPIVERGFEPPPGLEPPPDEGPVPVLEVDRRSAELAKYTANAFLAMRISFINEVANVCDRLGADVEAVASVIGADPRIGRHFLHAGVGYGGSCFPKDTRALERLAASHGYDFELVSAVIRVNASQRLRVLDKLHERLGELRGARVAVLGLAFKPGTDDMREAPSVPLVRALLERGAEVRAHDPRALDNARRLLPSEARLTTDVRRALHGADALVLLTEWPEYLALAPRELRELMRNPVVIDGRNAFPPSFRDELEYVGIGRGAMAAAAARGGALAAD